MKILVVEDNESYGEFLTEELKQAFGPPDWLKSESDFRYTWTSIVEKPPDVAVIDVMLKWDVPRREKRPRPADAPNMYRAGIRCARMLKSDPKTQSVPIVLYSVVEPDDLKSDLAELSEFVKYMAKSSPSQLVNVIRDLATAANRPAGRTAG